MKRYETYKDSGIQWVGAIPSHWDSNKLKFFADISTGTTPSTANEEYWNEATENWYTPADFNEGDIHLNGSSRKVSAMAFEKSACKVFKKNVVLVVGIGATLGKIGFSRVECSANQQITAIEFYDNVYPLFGAYYLSSLKEVMKSLASAATLAIMNQSVTGSIPFVCPTLAEQETIAAFLDHKVGQIDATIAEKEQMLEDLKAYRSAIISEAVTKGLDKNVEMKDSGIEWMGEIPSHWDIVKTSYLFDDIGSGTTPNTNDDSLYDADNGINWLQTGDLNDGHITKTSKKISQKAIEGNSTLRLYPVNSLVIALYGATIGKVGVLDIETTTNQACCVLPPSDKVLTDYAYYVFITSKKALLNLASGGGQPNISQAIIKNHRIPYPSYVEQQAITTYLDNKVEQIDKTLLELESQINDLKSYKSTLITEAVTGKIDLRDWKPKEEKV